MSPCACTYMNTSYCSPHTSYLCIHVCHAYLCINVPIFKCLDASMCSFIACAYTDYRLLGPGWCLISPFLLPSDYANHAPAFAKVGATKAELQEQCSKFDSCTAIEWGNTASGILYFSSVAAMEDIELPGYKKHTRGFCQSNCELTTTIKMGAASGPVGECWLKKIVVPLSSSNNIIPTGLTSHLRCGL